MLDLNAMLSHILQAWGPAPVPASEPAHMDLGAMLSHLFHAPAAAPPPPAPPVGATSVIQHMLDHWS